MNKTASLFAEHFDKRKLCINEPMKNHTTFRIGGEADVLFLPENEEEIGKAVSLAKAQGIDYFIMGNGSNLLVRDQGIRGAVIKIGKNMSEISLVDEETVFAQAGATLAALANTAMKNSLTGLEFASGIPGTVGGGITMNAGAYGGEMKDCVKEVTVMTQKGEILTLSNEEMAFGYRQSKVISEKLTVLSAVFSLNKGNKEQIKALMEDLNARRREKQPLNYPSAGSTFKRPEGHFAGKLIMDAGLRGYKMGGAMVSELHCGFVINADNASCQDVLALIEYVKTTVYNQFGVLLEPEVKIIG